MTANDNIPQPEERLARYCESVNFREREAVARFTSVFADPKQGVSEREGLQKQLDVVFKGAGLVSVGNYKRHGAYKVTFSEGAEQALKQLLARMEARDNAASERG